MADIKKTKDFMGIVTAVSEEIRLNKEERVTHLVLLDLVDDMGTIRCALFGSLVDTILGCLSQPRTGLPIIIV
ncbi:hypothetical protein SESBI_07467 [Sesbania bispinosa]|nr:hypothetical protein SESBI_07467 [Sesbania bispinosa]